ncbi:hypothetical protein FN846DRAFT_903790 [Sphaerosporella brunnea]|uniref:Uncharacterized protein n=1 Tax=Sphaerosporella brunnea TaxID=1250544 RepID=A0A5J5F624_9PEZI|nr:hypothetical protein FN846DRAFT_903790 [Sphaerosporella brunnea]
MNSELMIVPKTRDNRNEDHRVNRLRKRYQQNRRSAWQKYSTRLTVIHQCSTPGGRRPSSTLRRDDGATTHVTGGTVDRTQVLAYHKHTIITAEHSSEATAAIDVCETRLMCPLDEEEHMVHAGDFAHPVTS